MAKTIKEVFEAEGAHLRFDKKMAERIIRYVQGFMHKNEDHINFYGTGLLGVYPLRFKQEDRNYWFDDVLEMDDLSLKRDIHSLPTVDASRQVVSDVTNLSFIWVLHKLKTAEKLSESLREEAMVLTLVMLQSKFTSSRLSHDFRFPADKSVALATYNELSRKFSVKQHGNWKGHFIARSKDILGERSIHYKTIIKFADDDAVAYMLSDIQTRSRDVINKMRTVFYRVHSEGGRIQSQSSMIELEGQQHVRDKVIYENELVTYIQEVTNDRTTFIKDELVDIIQSAMTTMPRRHLVEALEYMSDNIGHKKAEHVEQVLKETIVHALEFIRLNNIPANDLSAILTRLRYLYMASKNTEETMLLIRRLANEIAENSVTSRNPTVKAAVRTGLLLYVVLRALARKHYG